MDGKLTLLDFIAKFDESKKSGKPMQIYVGFAKYTVLNYKLTSNVDPQEYNLTIYTNGNTLNNKREWITFPSEQMSEVIALKEYTEETYQPVEVRGNIFTPDCEYYQLWEQLVQLDAQRLKIVNQTNEIRERMMKLTTVP